MRRHEPEPRTLRTVAAVVGAVLTGLTTAAAALSIRLELDGFGTPRDTGPRWSQVATALALPAGFFLVTLVLALRARVRVWPLVTALGAGCLVLAGLVLGVRV